MHKERSITAIFSSIFAIPLVAGLSWTASSYPNPFRDSSQCGNSAVMQICDPDAVLLPYERREVNDVLLDASSNQAGVCRDKGLTVTVALVDRVATASSNASTADVVRAVQEFARQIADKWRLDPQCNKDVIIVVSKGDRAVRTSYGSSTGLSADAVDKMFANQMSLFGSNRYKDGIIGMVREMDAAFRATMPNLPKPPARGYDGKDDPGIPWWVWIIIICIIIPCVCCCCLCYFCKKMRECLCPCWDKISERDGGHSGGGWQAPYQPTDTSGKYEVNNFYGGGGYPANVGLTPYPAMYDPGSHPVEFRNGGGSHPTVSFYNGGRGIVNENYDGDRGRGTVNENYDGDRGRGTVNENYDGDRGRGTVNENYDGDRGRGTVNENYDGDRGRGGGGGTWDAPAEDSHTSQGGGGGSWGPPEGPSDTENHVTPSAPPVSEEKPSAEDTHKPEPEIPSNKQDEERGGGGGSF